MKINKQAIIALVASISIVALKPTFVSLFALVNQLYLVMLSLLGKVFSMSAIGLIIQKVLALLLIPIIIVAIVAGVYWALKRKKLPSFMTLFWGIWLMLTAIIVLK